MARPLTQREIQLEKQRKAHAPMVTLLNTSKQAVGVQLRAPAGVDFFVGEQTVTLLPGKFAKFPSDRLYDEQVENHRKAGRIRLVS